MNLVLSDNGLHLKFAPLTLTRPLAELRMGLFTNAERWSRLLNISSCIHFQTDNPFIKEYYTYSPESNDLLVNASIISDLKLAKEVEKLKNGESLYWKETWIASKGISMQKVLSEIEPVAILEQRWDLYLKNEQVLKADFDLLRLQGKSQTLSKSNTVIGEISLIYLEEGAQVEACILNTSGGPIYIGKNAEIMEGSMVRGPFALGEDATVKMGSKIYGGTSIGPNCKVGGEISNSIFLEYSNKGHDGFIGNAYIGAWCNLGADTNCSNLKNNYSPVKTYDFVSESMIQTDVTFMGVFMGDHSKCSINTMFNTATVVGVSTNIFSVGFPVKFIPSFAWGENDKFKFEKALEVAEAMMNRRGLKMSDKEKGVLKNIYQKLG